MWAVAGALVAVLLVIWGAYAVGKRQGKTEEKKDDAEQKAEDMAEHAEIAAKPTPNRPLSSLRPR